VEIHWLCQIHFRGEASGIRIPDLDWKTWVKDTDWLMEGIYASRRVSRSSRYPFHWKPKML